MARPENYKHKYNTRSNKGQSIQDLDGAIKDIQPHTLYTSSTITFRNATTGDLYNLYADPTFLYTHCQPTSPANWDCATGASPSVSVPSTAALPNVPVSWTPTGATHTTTVTSTTGSPPTQGVVASQILQPGTAPLSAASSVNTLPTQGTIANQPLPTGTVSLP